MTEAENEQRAREYMARDFLGKTDRMAQSKSEDRIAAAAEYTAHHVGKISRNLERLIEVLEKRSGSADGGTY